MASVLEDRLWTFIQQKAENGRLIMRADEIATALGETRGPIYKALTKLSEKKIKTENQI